MIQFLETYALLSARHTTNNARLFSDTLCRFRCLTPAVWRSLPRSAWRISFTSQQHRRHGLSQLSVAGTLVEEILRPDFSRDTRENMDRFATLEPVKLYANAATATFLGRPSKKGPELQHFHFVGRLPVELYRTILFYLPVPDLPAFSRCSRQLSEFAREERVWEGRWKMLGADRVGLHLEETLKDLDERAKGNFPLSSSFKSTSLGLTDSGEDDFGDFASGSDLSAAQNMLDVVQPFQGISLSSHPAVLSESSYRQRFIRIHSTLKRLLPSLASPPHLVLTSLFPPPSVSLTTQSRTLYLLAFFLSPQVQPVRNHESLYASLRSAIDRFQATLLTAFDAADERSDEEAMKDIASASWDVWEGHLNESRSKVSEWEMGRVWAEKREIFYEEGSWKPLDNFSLVSR